MLNIQCKETYFSIHRRYKRHLHMLWKMSQAIPELGEKIETAPRPSLDFSLFHKDILIVNGDAYITEKEYLDSPDFYLSGHTKKTDRVISLNGKTFFVSSEINLKNQKQNIFPPK